MGRDLEKEKQLELAAIWGGEVDGDARYPKRRGIAKKAPVPTAEDEDAPMDADVLSDAGDSVISDSNERDVAKPKAKKKALSKAKKEEYRLHCFVEPGTEINSVRMAFEAYEPKVEIRTAQKGNLLNKSQFAVLTFKNKAMALHAVQTMDGTNQRDLLGVTSVKMNLMLNRQQSKIARRKLSKKIKGDTQRRLVEQEQSDREFIEQFMKKHLSQSR